jgi:hypothetical protein
MNPDALESLLFLNLVGSKDPMAYLRGEVFYKENLSSSISPGVSLPPKDENSENRSSPNITTGQHNNHDVSYTINHTTGKAEVKGQIQYVEKPNPTNPKKIEGRIVRLSKEDFEKDPQNPYYIAINKEMPTPY